MNTGLKGSRMEHLCLVEFKEYMSQDPRYTLMKEWRVIRNRFHNNDYLGDWDLALYYKFNVQQANVAFREFRIQVKLEYSIELFNRLLLEYPGKKATHVRGYLAVYDHAPKMAAAFKTKHFWFMDVSRS